ncbi:MAG: MMPL family transporter, partial [Nevskia sp.]|uniref:MMPL family transporter n=1 Tax=Nevskia sp. TaxID=1929292 RepID=UPI0040357402
YKDHQAATITRALALAQESALIASAGVTDLVFEPGGGIVGVSAAANEALHSDHMIMVPLVMVAAFVLVMLYYQSLHAGWLMVLPMLFATIMTYAYMGWAGIGVSVNTVPVIMVGVGVGIDYAVYFMDRIREEMEQLGDIRKAAINAVATTGYAVSFTAVTLIAGVVLWIFMSDLRFQSDAAVLLSFMLIVNAVAAMLIVPAWCVAFRPRFVVGAGEGAVGRAVPASH